MLVKLRTWQINATIATLEEDAALSQVRDEAPQLSRTSKELFQKVSDFLERVREE